jgi:hypothetical protein
VRCATRIENVLMMRNVPTTREMAAKTSRNVLRKSRAEPIASCVSAATSSPVAASRPAGSTSATAAAASRWVTPSAAVTAMLS